MDEKHQTSSSSADSIHNDKEYYPGDVASVEQQESVEKKEPYKLKRTLKARHLSVDFGDQDRKCNFVLKDIA